MDFLSHNSPYKNQTAKNFFQITQLRKKKLQLDIRLQNDPPYQTTSLKIYAFEMLKNQEK